jgi:hypothetical protein
MQKRGMWCMIRAKALDPDPFPCRSLRHAVYAAMLHFGLESAVKNRLRTGSWQPALLNSLTVPVG